MSQQNEQSNTTNLLLYIGGVLFLSLDIYIHAYQLLDKAGITIDVLDNIILKLRKIGLLDDRGFILKIAILILLIIISLGAKPRKEIEINKLRLLSFAILGILMYFMSNLFGLRNIPHIITTVVGYFTLMYAAVLVQKFIKGRHLKDRFDIEGREFEQNEVLMENEYSVNIPFKYKFKKKVRNGWINIVNGFRAVLVSGVPGSGKTFAILEEALRQMIQKGFAMCVYDYKYPDLTQATYSYLTEYYDEYDIKPTFHVINLDDPRLTHRCNPLQPELLTDFSDAMESARSIMLGMNKSWIKKEGDFFVESPINLAACGIWTLKLVHEALGEQYCTFPHLIELISLDYDNMFGCLTAMEDTSISNIMSPFLAAWESQTMEQLEGQIASVRLGLSRITNKSVYWTTTGNDFTLDINNPKEPKIMCLANNPDRQSIYGVVLSLYSSRMIRLINKKGRRRTGLIFDELPTIFLGIGTLDNLIATGRSNLIACYLGVQEFTQIVRDYGKEVAEAIINICGNVITGMIGDKTAESFQKKIGKIKIRRTSVNVSRNDTSVNMSESMEPIAPVDVLSKLGQGEVAGIVADNYDESIPMEKKAFIGKANIDKKYKKLAKKHKLPQLTEFPEDIDIDELQEQNMENIKGNIKQLSILLNFDVPYDNTTDKSFMIEWIGKFIQVTRKRKKDKIIRITSENVYNGLIKELADIYTSKALQYKEDAFEQLDGEEPSDSFKAKVIKSLMTSIRMIITEKVDNLANQETIQF